MADVREALAAAAARLEAAGVPNPRHDVELLLGEMLGVERLELFTAPERELPAAVAERFAQALARRATREPLQYILGAAGFMGLTLRCDRRALIPRPETEALAERALALLEEGARAGRSSRILELGTGSGAVAVALAKLAPAGALATPGLWATDISAEALDLARENAALHGVTEKFAGFFLGDIYDALPAIPQASSVRAQHAAPLRPQACFELILANLPYVREDERSRLSPEIREHEPAVALYGGPDGLALLRRLVAGAPAYLAAGGRLLFELADGQWPEAERLLVAAGFAERDVWPDLSGIARVAEGRLIPG